MATYEENKLWGQQVHQGATAMMVDTDKPEEALKHIIAAQLPEDHEPITVKAFRLNHAIAEKHKEFLGVGNTELEALADLLRQVARVW